MSISFPPVQSVSGATSTTGTSLTLTWPSNTTAGNFLFLGVAVSGGSGTTVNTPSGWTLLSSNPIDNSTNVRICTYYIENASSQSSVTITTGSSVAIAAAAAEWSGVSLSSSFDVNASSTGFSTHPATGTTGTTAQADEIAIGFTAGFIVGAGVTQTSPTNSFVSIQTVQAGTGGAGARVDLMLSDFLASSTGTFSMSTTVTVPYFWAGTVVTFKASATTDTTINPGAGSLTLSGVTPAFTQQAYRLPTAGSLVLSGAIPAIASYTLSGPSSGFLGVPSTNFTVTGIGITSNVVVTPADDGTGLFNPTSVTLTSGSPVQTFTYEPHEVGTKSISTTDNASLNDPAPISYVVSGYPGYNVRYASGYGATATNDAVWMIDPANTTGVAFSNSGVASVSVTIDYGVSVTISQFAGTVGYAGTMTDQWEYSTDNITYNALVVTATNTPSVGSGTYTDFYQKWTPNAVTVTGRYFRYSIKDTPIGSNVGQAGVTNLYGSPGATPVLGASGGIGGLAGGDNLYAGCWKPVQVVYDHSQTFHPGIDLINIVGRDITLYPNNIKVVQIGPTVSVNNIAPTGNYNIGNEFDGPTATISGMQFGSSDDAVVSNQVGLQHDNRYYYKYRWDAYWWSQTKIRLGFFLRNFANYFSSAYTTIVNNKSYQWTTVVYTSYYVKKMGFWDITTVVDYYIGRYTILDYTLPQIGTGDTATIPTVQFLNQTSPFEDPGNDNDPFSWVTLCNAYGDTCPTGAAVGHWDMYVSTQLLDNDTHTAWIPSAPFYNVAGASETSMDITVPCSTGSATPGTVIGIGLAYANVTGQDIFETCGSSIYGMSATFAIVQDVQCGGMVTGGPNAQTRRNADTFLSHIAYAWISGTSATGALKQAIIRNAVLGSGATAAWESVETIEASNGSDLGLTYLPNGRLYLCYDLSGSKKYRTNDSFGTNGEWSASATPSPAVSRHSATGRGQNQSFRFRALTDSSAGDIEFSQCRDSQGVTWTSPVTAVASVAVGPWCGGVYILDGYGLLYTKQTNSHIYWTDTVDPDTWTGVGTDTGKIGHVIGATRLSSGVIVAATWDSGTKMTRSLRSRDLGDTWEMDSSDIGVIPALDTPPALVSIEHYAFLVFQINDIPMFAMSVDGGETWV